MRVDAVGRESGSNFVIRLVALSDGTARGESWDRAASAWVPAPGLTLGRFWDAMPLSLEELAALGIPADGAAVSSVKGAHA